LGKLALDSQIQDTVPEHMRTSVFGRSETLLQLAWVIGGIVAVAIPTNATLGMIIAAVVLVAWASVVLIWNSGRSLPMPRRARTAAARVPGRRAAAERSDVASQPYDEQGYTEQPYDERSSYPTEPRDGWHDTGASPAPDERPVPRPRDEAETISVRRSQVPRRRPDDGRPPQHPGGWR